MGPTCPNCGTALRPDAPGGLCPTCLLQNLAEGSSQHLNTPGDRASERSSPPRESPTLRPGQIFGPYEIEALLGRGGMGDVYAARHVQHGRRVALKLLSQELRDPEDRRRFLQEGEMAAAINHQHCVYVYGSEEIDGLPVISMELLPGGTLKDRVKQRGPLPRIEAVDLILQIIAGLDAARHRGVLHRDVKPSNCLVDSDGTVKIGDFGLSIPSTPAPGSAHQRLFHGTPGFAAPEQLRGEPLDLRADIYSVGATLYYLLSAEAPGGRPGLSALAAGVETKPPKPITAFRRDVSKPLASIIARCLSPAPAGRPSSYSELVAALTPFGSQNAVTATIGLRLAARLFDSLLLASILALTLGSLVGSGFITDQLLAMVVGLVVPAALYWALAERLFGFTFGKRACRLSVVANDGSRPGIARTVIRAAVWGIPIATLFALRIFDASPATSTLTLAAFAMAFLIPAVDRREPRLLHDLLSGTRVIMSRRRLVPSRPDLVARPLPSASYRQCGPYDIVGTISPTDRGELLLGFDSRLRRHVWIHVFRGDTESIPKVPRETRPSSRLRWLNGQRAAGMNWDAYEVPTGSSILAMSVPVSWRALRQWLLDLIGDFKAPPNRDSEVLSLARVWITADNRAKTLDFSLTWALPSQDAQSPVDLLRQVADRGLGGTPLTAMPLSGAAVISRLRHDAAAPLDEIESLVAASTDTESTVGWRQRGMALAAVALTYLVAGGWIGALVTRVLGTVVQTDVLSQHMLRIVSASGCALAALAWAAAWRGGFWLRTFGIAVVTSDGQRVSRTRAACRAAIVWSLVPLAAVAAAMGSPTLAVLISVAQLVIAVHATDHPQRGLHDRWAGTFLVPR